MVKRPHSRITKLGASEFATILNGDDGRPVLDVLQSFSETVQWERRQALQLDGDIEEDNDVDDDDDNENCLQNDSEPATKRIKEDWMKDSKDYRVPFVGTSIAKGETGSVVPGTWPTGLLVAYLKQSPFAIELVGNDSLIPPTGRIHKRLLRNKEGKLSFAIHKAYLKAIAELITAGISVSILKQETAVKSSHTTSVDTAFRNRRQIIKSNGQCPAFLARFSRDCLPGIIDLVLSETGQGNGKKGALSGIGTLTPYALKILTNMAQTSLGNARLVVQAMDDSVNESVFRIMMREPRTSIDKHEASLNIDQLKLQYRTRSYCIRLAVTLLRTRDRTVLSYISAIGSRERKTNPGILYLACRYGLQDPTFNAGHSHLTTTSENEYFRSISTLLEAITSTLFGKSDEKELLPRRVVADLLGAGTLQNLAQIVIKCAPHFESFEEVLNKEEKQLENISARICVGINARRLLFLLLTSESESPFLGRINYNEDDKLSSIYISFISKVLHQLNTSDSSSIHKFTVYCIGKSPPLLPAFYRGMQLPDVKKFQFLAKLRLVGSIMKQGPALSLFEGGNEREHLSQHEIDKLLLTVLPPKLNKQAISRALQCNNPLIVAESAKVLILALQRVVQCSKDCANVTRAFVARLPDVQTILATRSRFDPFVNPSRRNIILNGLLCRVLFEMSNKIPELIISTNFDWIKLLPEPISLFQNAEMAQLQILQLLGEIFRCKMEHGQERLHKPSPRTCRVLLEIVISASKESVYRAARKITKEMLLHFIELHLQDRNEEDFCLQEEISFWIDTIQLSFLGEFQELLEEVAKHSSVYKLTSIQILNKLSITRAKSMPYCFSLILSTSLLKLNSFSDDFKKRVYQIASRCLLSHPDPLPLAGLIINACENNNTEGYVLGKVMESYARTLIRSPSRVYGSNHRTEVLDAGTKLAEHVLNAAGSVTQAKTRSILILRRELQVIFLFGESEASNFNLYRCLKVIRTMVRFLAQEGWVESISRILIHPAMTYGYLPKTEVAYFQVVSLLCFESKHHVVDMFENKVLNITEELKYINAGPSSQFLFDLMKVWLLQPLVDSPMKRFIDEVIRAATMVCTSDTKLCKFYQCYALDWVDAEYNLLCEGTVWEAWKGATVNCTVLSEINIEFVLAMSHSLCKMEGKSEAVLYCKIMELGIHEFLGRCLRLIKMAMKHGYSSKLRQFSILAKAVQVGCLGIVPSLLLLATLKEIDDLDDLLLHYRISALDLQFIRKHGLLDSAIASIAKRRDDELVQMSVQNLIKSNPDSNQISRILSEIALTTKIHKSWRSLPPCGNLLASIVSLSGDDLHCKDTSYFSFLVLVDSIPKALKNVFSVSEGGDDSIEFIEHILDDTIELVQDSGKKWTDISLVDIDPVVRACLKHGIVCPQNRSVMLAKSCLKLVRFLLILYSNQTRKVEKGNELTKPNLIWCMVLSHSKFTEAILCKDQRLDLIGTSPRLQIVKLLLCCTCLSDQKMPIEKHGLNTLLTAYNGGTTQFDKILRRLLDYLEESMGAKEFVFGDEICQRILDTSYQLKDSRSIEQGWEFLANSIDLGRVYSTLSQFPYRETLPLTEMANVNFSLISNEDTHIVKNDDEERVICDESYDLWRGRGADHRYDPSFLVPQILAGLENTLMKDCGFDSDTKFAQYVQRLCDRGGFGICLASLCSLCKTVRKFAFAALCLFHRAMNSEAAKSITRWRDRPQLNMLLNSIQRGIVLQIKKSNSDIPRLAPPSAIFLAKASLVLSKPGHTAYTAINKYFLRLDKACGAYDDMTRVPSFIPLFCSHSQDHSKQERNFAIQCVRDSCLDTNSFRIISVCHAPDLLMTTASQNCLDDTEFEIIMEALTRMLQFGELFAVHSLLGRAGLLSWLRVLLNGQGIGLSQSMLKLIKVAADQGIKYMANSQQDQLILDLRNLLAPLASAEPSMQLCDTFCYVTESLLTLDYSETLSPSGISVSSILALLAFNVDCPRLLKAACTAPIDEKTSLADCLNYCRDLLKRMSHLQGCSITFVLQRIHRLASLDLVALQEEKKNWSETLQLILASHVHATASCRGIYHKCLRTVLSHTSVDDKWSRVGIQLLTDSI